MIHLSSPPLLSRYYQEITVSLRCQEPGWTLAAMNDPVRRRGLWYKVDNWQSPTVLEVCGGREGDDYYLKLELGQTVTNINLKALDNVLSTCRWVLEQNPEFDPDLKEQR